MSLGSRRELLETTAERYRFATKKQKGVILEEFLATTEYNRKYAIVLLNQPSIEKKKGKRRRRRRYDKQVGQALIRLWKAANRICSKRLVPFLPDLIDSLERHGHLELTESVREKLFTISCATADRLRSPERKRTQRGVSTTKIVKLTDRNKASQTDPDPTVPRRYRHTSKPTLPRTWRTRKDPFAEVWSELQLRLERDSTQTAKCLFQDLQQRHPGQYKDGQLRTLQRRVREWRQEHSYQYAAAVAQG